MIDVSPYIDKLEGLRGYMGGLIDGKFGKIMINIGHIPKWPVEKIMQIFYETGCLYYYQHEESIEPAKQLSFDEWYNSKNTKQ